MKNLILVLAVVLALTNSLPYLAHSFNDLDYFVQLLKKGVRNFKLDMSLVAYDSCLAKSTWNESMNSCFYQDPYPQQICCLGLRGDASSTPVYNYPFNTSYEFVALFSRQDLAKYFKQKVFIEIDFQYSDSQNNLTKMFLYNLMRTINASNLSVTIAAGTDNIILDYDYKCVISGKCKDDPISQYISDSGIILQSGSYQPYHPHDVKKRYRNFNVFYRQITSYCMNGFPDWVDKYDYPLVFWEPSDESSIQFVAETFLSKACKRPAKHSTLEHIAITSNLDPEMVSNYLQDYKTDYGYGKKVLMSKATNQMLTSVKIDGQDVVLIAYKSLQDNTNCLQIRDPNTFGVRLATTIPQEIISIKGQGDMFFLCAKTADGTEFRLYDTLLQLRYSSFSNDFRAITYDNGLVYYVRNISSGYYNLGISDIAAKRNTITGCSLSFLPTDMVMSDQLYVVGTKMNNATGKSEVWISYNFTAEAMLGFGSNPRIVKYLQNGESYLSVLIHDGPCQSAAWINNNQMNKCLFWQQEEFQSLVSVPNLVSYIQGSLESFKQLKTQNESKPIGSCTDGFRSAKVYNGKGSSHTVIAGKTIALYEYVGISEQSVITSLFCGASNFDNLQNSQGVLLSSFVTTVISPQKPEQIVA